MYFANRIQAGRMLAEQIAARYQGSQASILALSDGGVVVGMQIAQALHAPIGLLLTDQIELPRETAAIAGVTQDGAFAYNKAYSTGEIDEIVSEFRGIIEEQKIGKIQKMHRLMGAASLVRRDLLTGRNIILVSDGMTSGFSIELALEFLKPVSYKKLVVATPLASVPAVDRMHVMADDLYCLDVIQDYITTDHYYDAQDVPDHEVIVQTVGRIMQNWQ